MKKDYFENNALFLDSDAKVQRLCFGSKKYLNFFLNYLRQQPQKTTKSNFFPKSCRNHQLFLHFIKQKRAAI